MGKLLNKLDDYEEFYMALENILLKKTKTKYEQPQ